MTSLFVSSALTLGLLGGLLLLLRRARGTRRSHGSQRGLEVLDRVSLGPKQGVSAIRVAGRVVVVSTGEGGIRSLTDLPETEWTRALEARSGSQPEEPRTLRAPRLPLAITGADRRLIAPRLRRFLTFGVLMCVTAWPHDISATAPYPAPAATAELEQAADQQTGDTADAGGAAGLIQALPSLTTQGVEEDAPLELSGPIGTALLLGVMALLPTLLLLATGFTRILIVLHLLKQALGAQAVPPTHLINALALLLTLFLMGPTLDRASTEAIDPWLDGEITQTQMFERVSVPFRDFMLEQADEDDVARFVDLRGEDIPSSIEEVRFTTLMAAFTTSELKRAFQLGFALFLPFIVIDLVVASVLMSMGMFMLPPVMISLPFKLLLFVLADGWQLVVGGLLRSFG